jgi:hypothetical protein
MTPLTLNQAIKVFEDFAASHKMIKSFKFGTKPDIDSVDSTMLPAMFVTANKTVTRLQVQERTWNIMIYDAVAKDESNFEEVMSDTEQTMLDLIKTIRNSDLEFDLVGDPEAIPFRDKFADEVSGYSCDITFSTTNDDQMCDIPQ